MKRYRYFGLSQVAICWLMLSGLGCGEDQGVVERPDGWTEETHSDQAAPNYDLLFCDQCLHRFDIEISADDHQAMQDDLEALFSGGSGGDRPGQPGMDPGTDLDEDPIWVPVNVHFNGLTWEQVGMRYKGNSSLRAAWQSGVRKLAFRLNMDKLEDTYPAIDDQRFYGFEKMTFSNGYKDDSLMRDKLAGDMFRAAGVPVARSAFAAVYVDTGSGPTYFGLYTMIEDPSDAMLDEQFADGSGNLYKPEGTTANWAGFDAADFEKKTNENSEFDDVRSAVTALLDEPGDDQTWRNGLEQVFDVYGFLRVLAVNQAMVNWDSYGCMPHNYYLYANPADENRIVWFPWDLNEALMSGGMPGCRPESILLDEIGDEWPLIRRLLDDDQYRQAYLAELELALDTAMPMDWVSSEIDSHYALISPYVVGPEAVEEAPYTFLSSQQAFADAPGELERHLESRHSAVGVVLGD